MCIRDSTGMVEILTQSDLDVEQRQVVGIIQESSECLLQIIGDILDFSKIEAGKLELSPQTFSVRALVDSCLLYTSDAADERSSVDLGGRRIIKKKKKEDRAGDVIDNKN